MGLHQHHCCSLIHIATLGPDRVRCAKKIMEVEDFSSITIFTLVILSLVAVFAVLGNGFVLGIIARFKKLRTFPNILISNLALVDFSNALINGPLYLLWGVLKVKWFTGKTLAIISIFLLRLFMFLNVVSMLVLLGNAFLAIALNLKYFTWKTNEKALAIVLGVWMVCVTSAVISLYPHSDTDLQDASVSTYRLAFMNQSNLLFTVIGASFVVTAIVLGVMAYCAIQLRKRQVRRQRIN